MTSRAHVLGIHQPGDGWLHRAGVGWKYLLMLVLSLTPILVDRWPVTLGFVALNLLVLSSSGIGVRRGLAIGWMVTVLMLALGVFHLLTGGWADAICSAGGILCAILAARLLTLTTPTPLLVDALAAGLRWLRWVRVDPHQVALAVSLMIRSIPFLLGSLDDARDAARARGLERKVHRLLLPVVLGAVSYAERTGEAMQARGLGERAHADDAPPVRG